MKHVRDQNWLAVGLDFLIVVVGVFIGIQVANWNDERRFREEEIEILGRLSEEAKALIEFQRRQLERDERRIQLLIQANPVLFDEAPDRVLNERECMVVATSHSLTLPQDDLPILDELLQTARFDRIRSTEIKARLRDYILLRERARSHFRSITRQVLELHIRHPGIVQVTRALSGDAAFRPWRAGAGEGYHWQPVCDVDAMRNSRQFLNEVVENVSRLSYHVAASKDRMASVVAIDEALIAYLGQAPGHKLE